MSISANEVPERSDGKTVLDLRAIDQLGNGLLKMSENCFELKKLCLTILISGSVLVASFTADSLNHALFVAALVVAVFFWTLDAQSYFYQERLRARMKELEYEVLVADGQSGAEAEGIGIPLTDKRSAGNRWRRSFFNESMLFYLLLALVDGVIWLTFVTGAIG